MSDIVIKAENIGKMYTIGHQSQRGGYTTFRESLVQNVRTIWNKSRDLVSGKPIILGDTTEEVWALNDLNFNIRRGEAVGIIGRNGAGKSTLLKLLSRITEPSKGVITIKGRVASLLEVGTGFHPELSGRENIFLNGTILGMSRKEILSKFDEIVAFAEVEKFLDTPVKRYSSGMYVRLAFAVAAHLEPEILVVDEVLAVGDAQFQKKCLGKMGDVAKGGRTVLFVSHNMAAIENLCQRTIWINEGRIRTDGETRHVLPQYLSQFVSENVIIDLENFKDRSGNGVARIVGIQLLNTENQPTYNVRMGEALNIRFSIRYDGKTEKQIVLGMYLYTENGILVSDFRTNHMGLECSLNPGINIFDLCLDSIHLYPRTYFISPWIADSYIKEDIDWVRYAAKFAVEDSDFLGTGAHFTAEYGITHIRAKWNKIYEQ